MLIISLVFEDCCPKTSLVLKGTAPSLRKLKYLGTLIQGQVKKKKTEDPEDLEEEESSDLGCLKTITSKRTWGNCLICH